MNRLAVIKVNCKHLLGNHKITHTCAHQDESPHPFTQCSVTVYPHTFAVAENPSDCIVCHALLPTDPSQINLRLGICSACLWRYAVSAKRLDLHLPCSMFLEHSTRIQTKESDSDSYSSWPCIASYWGIGVYMRTYTTDGPDTGFICQPWSVQGLKSKYIASPSLQSLRSSVKPNLYHFYC